MPKATFEDFIKDSNFDRALISDNADARAIFDILNEDGQIYEAICASEKGKPALEPSIWRIEEYVKSQREKHVATLFDLNSVFNRQIVGRMQQSILARFGYKKCGQGAVEAEWFSEPSCYRKLNDDELETEKWKGRKWKDVATMRITIQIMAEEISGNV